MTDSISVLERKPNSGRNPNYNYSLEDFDGEEKTAVRAAKKAAVKNAYLKDASGEITELGTGSHEKTQVYRVPNQELSGEDMAVKVISCATRRCEGADLEEEKKAFYDRVVRNGDVGKNIRNEIVNCINVTEISNVLPFDDYDILTWKCEEYKRIGIDYVLKMPLAQCMTDRISKYSGRKQGVQPEKPENLDEILKVGIDVCTALIGLHKRGIIHRDIKPANIFWFGDNYCLGDFGIAANENNLQDFNGTSAYWAPEQAEGSRVDHRVDIYSLGLVLYELADTCDMKAHYEQRINRHELPELGADISAGLKAIIRNACAYNPNARYQTAEGLKEDLCWLKKNPEYVPQPVKPVINSYISNTMFSRDRNKTANTPFGNRGRDAGLRRYLVPELAWNAGKFWYETSCESGSRFASLDIDKYIMPLSLPSAHVTDLPINVCTDPEKESEQKPLSQIIADTQKIQNMYLIGEGGIGKTTALFSIMEDTYKDSLYSVCQDKKTIVPLFIELSKAPADYCAVYEDAKSTFIHRYLFMLISSFDEKHLISENPHEMAKIMQERDSRAVDRMNILFENETDNVQYLLLLDGLNEVSRKQLSDSENDFIGTPAELIINEIQELLRYKNISVVITSRADEALNDMEDEFERFYLTGVSEDAIKEYLLQHYISFEEVRENARLMETLKIPLFLKMYSKLDVTSEVSTPGEILYAFFSERSAKYTVRERINEIKRDRRMSGEAHPANLITEKMQWFILDFLLPKLGWYMEKNELYTVDLKTIAEVIDPILKGTEPTDICGEYGIALFSDYHNGRDGSVNTRTCAAQLLALGLGGQNYVKEIVDCCVNSLGILYVNNQSYGFVHQHIRDFFAALKIVTDMKMTLYIPSNQGKMFHCLNSIGEEFLGESVAKLIGDILKEYQNRPVFINEKWIDITPETGNRSIITGVLGLCRNIFSEENLFAQYAVKNLLKIIYFSRHTFNGFDFSDLDLRSCYFNNRELKDANMSGCLINRNNLFADINCGEIYKTAFSKSGKYVYIAGEDGTISLWNRRTFDYIKNIKTYERYSIWNISVSEKYIAVSTEKKVEILDIRTAEVVKSFKGGYNAIFSPNGRYIVVAFYLKKARLYNISDFKCMYELSYVKIPQIFDFIRTTDLICFSNDNQYLAMVMRNSCVPYWGASDSTKIEIWDITKKNHLKILVNDCENNEIANLDFSSKGDMLLVMIAGKSILKVYFTKDNWKSARLLHSIDIEEYIHPVGTYPIAKFVQNDSFIAIGTTGGHLFCLNYEKYNKEHILKISDLKAHSFAISNMTKFEDQKVSYLITGSIDCSAKLWDMSRLQYKGSFNRMNLSGVASAFFAMDGKYILSNAGDNNILIWNVESGKCVDSISDLPTCPYRMAYHDENGQLAVSLIDGRVILYNFNYESLKFSYLRTVEMRDRQILQLEYSVNGEKLLAVDYDYSDVTIYNTVTKKQITIAGKAQCIRSVAFYDKRGETIVIGEPDCHLRIYSTNTGDFIKEIQSFIVPYCESVRYKWLFDKTNKERPANAIAIDFDNNLLYILKSGAILEVLDINTSQCIALLNPVDVYFGTKIVISKSGKYITTTTSEAPNTKIYAQDDWKVRYRMYGMSKNRFSGVFNNVVNFMHRLIYKNYNGHKRKILDISFSPDEQKVLTASADGTVKVWPLLQNENDEATVKVWPLLQNENDEALALTAVQTLKCVPGLKTQGLILKHIHPKSNLSGEDIEVLKSYGVITED